MADVEDERPPGEEEEEETQQELAVATPVVHSPLADPNNLKAPGNAEGSPVNKKDEGKLNGDAVAAEGTVKAEEQTSTPASEPQAAVSAAAEAVASAAPVDPYAGYTGYDPAAAGYDYSAYWAQYGYNSGYYSGVFCFLLVKL